MAPKLLITAVAVQYKECSVKNKRSFNDLYSCYLFPRMNTRYVRVYSRTTYNDCDSQVSIWGLHCMQRQVRL